MKIVEDFNKLSQEIKNPYINKWLEEGKKVIGYFCTYVPEEIIYAAGALPFRMRATGSTETTLGDSYLSNYNCSFTRHCLDLAMRDSYSFLEGVVMMNSCDHIRRLYDIWKRKIDSPFSHFIKVPRKRYGEALSWYRDELINFKEALEKHFQVKITEEKLRNTIKLYNESRTLLRNLYELRKEKAPPISGSEVLSIVIGWTAMPKEDFNRLLRELLDELKGRSGRDNYRARLMFISGILDDPAYIKVFEDLGGLVVTDSSCFGTRAIWELVDETKDPIEAIAERYLTRISCPRIIEDHQRRFQYIKEMMREFKVDGLICGRLVFCDLWGGENYMLHHEAKEAGIPILMLDREYKLGGVGQLKNRVQAFLEMIESDGR